jgi:hypothetical protein
VQIPVNGSRAGPDGKGRISAADLLGSNSLFVKNGVNVLRTIPESVQFEVDQLVTADADVRIPSGTTIDSAVFTPSTVQIRGPQKLIQSLKNNHQLWVTADLAGDAKDKKPGLFPVPDVALLKPVDNPDLTLLTTTVAAQMTIKSTDIAGEIDHLQIFISTPTSLTDDTVTLDKTVVTKIQITGPPDKVKALADTTNPLNAYAEATVIDPDPIGTATLRYVNMPAGVTVVSDDLSGHVGYKVHPR